MACFKPITIAQAAGVAEATADDKSKQITNAADAFLGTDLSTDLAAELKGLKRVDILRRLRAVIQRIEGRNTRFKPFAVTEQKKPSPSADVDRQDISATPSRHQKIWGLGEPAIDRSLGPMGLDCGGLHEIKPALQQCKTYTDDSQAGTDHQNTSARPGTVHRLPTLAGATAPALAFALRLLARRMADSPDKPVLWCSTLHNEQEYGSLHGPGLEALNIDHRRLIIVRTQRASEALWAIEEALRSQVLAGVVAHIDDVGLTPARRLSLAAKEAQTPCIIVSHPTAPNIASTASRWRVSAAPVPSRFSASLLGGLPSQTRTLTRTPITTWTDNIYRIGLERCRQTMSQTITGTAARPTAGIAVAGAGEAASQPTLKSACGQPPQDVEWSDETLSFNLVSPLAHGAPGTSRGRRRSYG